MEYHSEGKDKAGLYYRSFAALFILLTLFFYWGIHFVDLPSFYYGIHAVISGSSPYDFEALNEMFEGERRIYPFLYPPSGLLVFYPFTFLSYHAASVSVLVINCVLVVAIGKLLFFKFWHLEQARRLSFFVILIFFLFEPTRSTINHGQINLLVLICIILSWLFYRDGKNSFVTALPLSIAIILKTSPALFLLLFLIRKEYRVCAYSILLIVLAGLLSLTLFPASLWAEWFTVVAPNTRYGNMPLNLFPPASPYNQSLNGFFARLFFESEWGEVPFPNAMLAKYVPLAVSLLVLFVTVILSWRTKDDRTNKAIDLNFILFLIALFLMSPLSWIHHMVFVLPAFMFLIIKTWQANIIKYTAWVVVLIAALPFPVDDIAFQSGILIIFASVKLYTVLFVWVYAVYEGYRIRS